MKFQAKTTHEFVNGTCVRCKYTMINIELSIESKVITNDFLAESCEEFLYFVDKKIKEAPTGHKWNSCWYGITQLRLICDICQQEIFINNNYKWIGIYGDLIMDCEEAVMNKVLM